MKEPGMDRTVIRKILDTSTRDLLGDKAADARQRRLEHKRSEPAMKAQPRRVRPVLAADAPVLMRARPASLDALPAEPEAWSEPEETYERSSRLDLDAIDELGDESAGSIEALHEAETDIGIATWLDPETGEPAEGSCPPHLDEQ